MTNKTPFAVTVYCGASEEYDPSYFEEARKLARFFAKNSIRLVYGASSCGLMGAMGSEALKNNGEVWGIITRRLVHIEKPFENLTKLTVVENMSLRKRALSDNGEILVVLPGGIGTLEEFFEVLVARQFEVIDKKILIFNQQKYWQPLISLIQHLTDNGALSKHANSTLFESYDNINALTARISELQAQSAKND